MGKSVKSLFFVKITIAIFQKEHQKFKMLQTFKRCGVAMLCRVIRHTVLLAAGMSNCLIIQAIGGVVTVLRFKPRAGYSVCHRCGIS